MIRLIRLVAQGVGRRHQGECPSSLGDLTWKCLVCGDVRPDEAIGVTHQPVPGAEHLFPGARCNVAHCVDRPACVLVASRPDWLRLRDALRGETGDYAAISWVPTPTLDRFIAASDDAARLALGLAVLELAWREAGDAGLVGWQAEVHEYVVAASTGRPLNRPIP